MPLHDSCQPAVITALQKDGWTLIRQQVYIERPDLYILIDLEARKADEQTYIEVKCFPGANNTNEFYAAFGQYFVYQEVIAHEMPGTMLYLAIPVHVWRDQFGETYRDTLLHNHVNIVLVDIESEVVVQWMR